MQIKALSPPLLGNNFSRFRDQFCWYISSGKWKSHNFFSKWTNLWKKIFISRHNMIIFIYKSWSVNSGWLTLFARSKVTRGNSFAFKMLLTIFSLQEQSFLKKHCWFFFKKVKSSTLFFRRQKCITVTIDFTNREFVS